MTFHIITLFPSSFDSYLGESILKRAIEDKKININFYNPRDFTIIPKKRKQTYSERRVDDRPYGGGPGMVIEALPIIKAIQKVFLAIKKNDKLKTRIIWLTPSGKQFDTTVAKSYAKKYKNIIIICGRYEGIDARVKAVYKIDEISVGPFVLTGGELPAMMIIDVVSRQVEGVLGNFDSLEESRTSISDVYTRPECFIWKGKKYHVPKVLLSGNRAKIDEWKMAKSKKKI